MIEVLDCDREKNNFSAVVKRNDNGKEILKLTFKMIKGELRQVGYGFMQGGAITKKRKEFLEKNERFIKNAIMSQLKRQMAETH